MRKIFKTAAYSLFALFVCAALYFAAAWGLSAVSVNDAPPSEDITLYLSSNGVHADLVMPLANDITDWRDTVSPADSCSRSPDAQFVGIGWGERNFYLHTPSWGDLTVPTAARALSGLNSTLIHATFYGQPPQEGERAVKFTVSREQYRRLAENIRRHFALKNGRAVAVAGSGYNEHDVFYEAQGRYHLFNTCNTWLNSRLKESGIKSVVWTPFAAQLLDAHR
ncbi:TIGR02117 family protein [Neisseria sp.]|uniref:TIGR02117 family protein n=1 Tax=Neisseria sp. TaxID=192066 RepID=UPI0035A13B60